MLTARLLCEARSLAQVSHPNVLAVYDSGLAGDRAYVAMELVQGQTLRRWLEREPRSLLTVAEALLKIGEGLAVVHQAGLIHRDIKPENILVEDGGRPLLIDFGLARATEAPEPCPGAEGPGGRAPLGRLTGAGRTIPRAAGPGCGSLSTPWRW